MKRSSIEALRSLDVELYYEESGEGPPIILLHGFGATTYSWREIVPMLATKHRVINVDLKGFGKSPKPRDKHYSIYDQARIVTALIHKMNLDDAIIIGHSYGGGVALVTALIAVNSESTRLLKLIIIDGMAYPQKLPGFVKLLRAPVTGSLAFKLFSTLHLTRSVLKLAYFDDKKIPEDAVRVYADPLRTSDGRRAFIQAARQIIPDHIDDLVASYKKIAVPTLIIWGREDKIMPLRVGELLCSAIPNSRLGIIEGCGHIPHEERPDETLRLILKFINQQ